jgi:4-carboxymuconolactone decarboxylase
MPDPAPRIPQISEAERTDEVRAMFAAIMGAGTDNVDDHYVLKTFAQHPALTRPFLAFNLHLLTTSTLPVRLRQIAILRVAWVKRARYMWASHMRMSLRLGLSVEDLQAAKQGEATAHWNAAERCIIHATEQLMTQTDLDDDTWNSLGAHLGRQQIMDLIFTVGAYVLIAMAFNAMRIQREPELIALAEQYGSPG